MKKRCLALLLVLTMLIPGCGHKQEESEPEPTEVPEPVLDIEVEDVELPEEYGMVDSILDTLNSKTKKNFKASRDFVTFRRKTIYGFCGNRSFELDYDNPYETMPLVVGDKIYVPASCIAEAFSFNYSEENDGFLEFNYKEKYSFKISIADNTVEFDGTSYAFYKPIMYNDNYYLNVENFAKLMDYSYEYLEDELIVMKANEDEEYDLAEIKAQYDNYDEVVYGDDVECDLTGVGLYDASNPEERLVGIAYSTWFWKSRNWSTEMWDTPLVGTYNSYDEDVIYQHGIWLRDAGVDFVCVDWSNNIEYDPDTMSGTRTDFKTIEEATEVLFKVWSTIPGAPKICIFTGPGHQQTSTNNCFTNGQMKKKNDQIYNTFLCNETYKDMYFYYEGKPLLLCYAATPSFFTDNVSPYEDERFTTRWVTGFVGQQSSLYDSETLISKMFWSWEERGAQTFTVTNNTPECMTVTAAQRAQGSEGSSGYIAAGLRDNGTTFKRQWARARAVGVKLALVVSFNEWVLSEQISAENSKDIEPSKIHGTLYLDIMREQIRRFKSGK